AYRCALPAPPTWCASLSSAAAPPTRCETNTAVTLSRARAFARDRLEGWKNRLGVCGHPSRRPLAGASGLLRMTLLFAERAALAALYQTIKYVGPRPFRSAPSPARESSACAD